MAKTKNRKRISVDQIQKKRENQNVKPLNPFEVHINKEKMRVLGKKLKNQKGLPGISRAKAIEKRKHTLLHEYELQHKSNKFMDKRIGEKSHMSEEDKATARFVTFKKKLHNKKNIYNLDEPEMLTHRGQTLSEIEKFDDPRSDDEDSIDEDKTGRLDSNFVEDAHFGGGILSNTGKEGAKTHKQLIEQLIEESKKRKAEKQKIKEATLELTEKLDNEWKDLVQLVSTNKKNKDEGAEKPKLDDYDKVMRELRFEARGTVSDRLKTEDEIAKEEKEKLEKLEKERLERMRSSIDGNMSKPNHRSADDLDDNFVYESDNEADILTYDQEGQSNVPIQAVLNGKVVGQPDDNEEIVDEDEDSENEEVGEEDSENSDSEDSLADLKEDDDESNEESDAEEKASEENKPIQLDKNKEKNSTKRKSTESNSEEENKNKKQKSDNEEVSSKKSSEQIKLSEAEQKEFEKAGNELPFTFKLPETYEALIETLKGHSHTHQNIILERMIKCNHPSLSQGNKEGLGLLFAYLLQYINDLFSDEETNSLKTAFKALKFLMPHIYELAQMNPENTHNSVLEVIKEKQQEYRKKKKKYPGVEVLVFLKLVGLLFSTSDFRHQIVTPCFVFIEQMLKNCALKTPSDISYGLFLCCIALEYTSLSNRHFPAVINFLSGIIHMAIPKTSVKIIKVLPPFKSLSSDLVLTKNFSKNNFRKLDICYLTETELTDSFRVSTLHVALKLLKDYKDQIKTLPSNVEIFKNVESYLRQLPLDLYPLEFQDDYKQLCNDLEVLRNERKLNYLIMEEKKPKALRLYEPKIEEVYDGRRHKVQSKEKAEREKLLYKLKKETKSALREIRKDKSFLGRVKINQRIKSDKERRDKVNRIYREAAVQQSELNALDRKKKKKK